MIKSYIKKPGVVWAYQWMGDLHEFKKWIDIVNPLYNIQDIYTKRDYSLFVETYNRTVKVCLNDYIIITNSEEDMQTCSEYNFKKNYEEKYIEEPVL